MRNWPRIAALVIAFGNILLTTGCGHMNQKHPLIAQTWEEFLRVDEEFEKKWW